MRRIIDSVVFNFSPKHEAFNYQKHAFEEIKELEYSAVFHEQGLGKTKIAIDLILYWLEKKDIDTVLIVTKKLLVQNWKNEFTEHTNLKTASLSSNKVENYFVFNSPNRVIITNFETICSDIERVKLFLKTRNVAVVIDESTKLKNPYSQVTKDFFNIASDFKIRVIMTGTPIANRPYDIWAQIYFLDQGKSLGNDFEMFKESSNLTNDLGDNVEKRQEFEFFIAQIFEKIKNFTVRETKESGVIVLPTKIYKNIVVQFQPDQLEMYSRIKDEMQLLVRNNGESFLDDSSESIKRLLRLLQVTSNPRLIDELYCEISAKEIALEKLIKSIVDKGEKMIIWSVFVENIKYFFDKYEYLSPAKVHGDMTIEDRNRNITRFKTDNACKVLFATPQSAKEGLTLTIANNVIFYDRGFSLDDYIQAQDRIHRISQNKPCFVYNLIIKNSIDIWIDKLLEAKQIAASLAQGDIDINKYKKNVNYDYGEIVRNILFNTEED